MAYGKELKVHRLNTGASKGNALNLYSNMGICPCGQGQCYPYLAYEFSEDKKSITFKDLSATHGDDEVKSWYTEIFDENSEVAQADHSQPMADVSALSTMGNWTINHYITTKQGCKGETKTQIGACCGGSGDNLPPVKANDDHFASDFSAPMTLDILKNDQQSCKEPTITITKEPEVGSVKIENGMAVYTPPEILPSDFKGVEFEYELECCGKKSTATVMIEFNPPEAPEGEAPTGTVSVECSEEEAKMIEESRAATKKAAEEEAKKAAKTKKKKTT